MRRIARGFLIFFLSVCFLIPAPCASAKASDVAKDILKIAGAQIIVDIIGPLFGLGPKKTKEEKEKEKQRKKEEKQDKEIEKAAKELMKTEKAKDAINNPETHISMVKKWADEGDVQAQCIMAYAYHTGQRVPRNNDIAMEWQKRATKQNVPLVKNFIPLEYENQVVPIERLFAIAGRRSHAGKYVEKSVEDAVRWSQMGAEEKDSLATAYLAAAYYTGNGMPLDPKKAVEIAQTVEKDPLSLHILIDAYQFGKGVERDTKKSDRYARYLKLVIDKKHEKEMIKMNRKYDKEIKAGDLYGIVR